MLSDFFQGDYRVTKLEIRKFYDSYTLFDRQHFDETFAKLANEHDLVEKSERSCNTEREKLW